MAAFPKGVGKAMIAGLIATALFCLPTASARANDKLSVACSASGLLFVVPYIAKQLGYFSRQGLDVDIYDANGGANSLAALVGGSADVAITGYKYVSVTVQKGQALKVVGTSLRGFPQELVVRPDLLSTAGLTPQSSLNERAALLRHRIIGVQDIGGSSGDFVRAVARIGGIADSDITVINIPTSDARIGSLKARRIDGFLDSSPAHEMAVASGVGVELVVPFRDMNVSTDFEYNVAAVRADFLKAHPDVVERFLRATQQVLDLVKSDPDKARVAAFAAMAAAANTDTVFTPEIRDAAWKNILPNIPDTVALDPAKLIAARRFFGISDQISDAQLTDNSIALKVAASAKEKRP